MSTSSSSVTARPFSSNAMDASESFYDAISNACHQRLTSHVTVPHLQHGNHAVWRIRRPSLALRAVIRCIVNKARKTPEGANAYYTRPDSHGDVIVGWNHAG